LVLGHGQVRETAFAGGSGKASSGKTMNFGAAATAEEIAKHFGQATKQRVELVEELLETLSTLGKARLVEGQKFISA
jgi:hypothetical protein